MLAVISYRRADSQDIAGRIGDHLRRRFGDRQVFLDTGSIPAGADFRHTIQEAMRRQGVLIAIVGPDWIGARNGATNRIDDHDDPVRMEIAAALDNGLPIIPVLVNGASMPTASELPDDLKDFSYRNALTIDRGRNFHRDSDDLVREIEALAPRGVWRRRAVAALVAAVAALVVTWLTVPDSAWHGLMRTVAAPVSDIEVASFRTPEGRAEFEFLRQKVERNFVDLFSDAKLRVRSALTTNQSLAPAHFTLAGGIVEQGGQVMVSAELRDAGGVVVASSQIEGALEELEGIYKVIPEALMYGMAVDTPTLSRNRRASRPTSSVEALAYFLQARREVQARDYEAAEWSLRHAFAIDPAFAMAYWAVGEVKRLQGDPAQAGEWYAKASAQNKDHPRWSVEPAREAQPVPALLAQLRAAEADELLPGAGYSVVRLPDYDLNLHVWSFDPKRFALKLRQQANAGGQAIGEFMTDPGDVLAINGGFFDTDSRQRLTPSGLLIVDGVVVRDVTEKGSGILFATADGVGIVRRQDFRAAGVVHAVQSGPLLVDPGGKLGIYKEDFDRQRRSAVCLDGNAMRIVMVEGGLSLLELARVLSTPREAGGLACDVALNLDGGPSSQAAVQAGGREISFVGRWRIQNALVVTRRARSAERR
ncbi:MAG TPA: phosphodiester glycosidase family protein [Xanthobacteraceae bacterium]|nr:phosphodiester glycosidase family protein [Xanthobacteraceae bacterium]